MNWSLVCFQAEGEAETQGEILAFYGEEDTNNFVCPDPPPNRELKKEPESGMTQPVQPIPEVGLEFATPIFTTTQQFLAFWLGWCAMVNKNPDDGADTTMSRNSGLLAFTSYSKYCQW